MKLYKKQAFSLTELMIVLIIIAILFAALAPIITKRRSGRNIANESIWNFVSDDDQQDAFYDPGHPKWTSTAYIGINPDSSNIKNTSPKAKVVVNAKKGQNMMQFRYGTGNGVLAGTLFMDDLNNVLLSSSNPDFVDTATNKGTTVLGPYAFQRKTGNYATVLGAEALRGTNNENDANYAKLNNINANSRYIMIGNSAGKNLPSSTNSKNLTFVGSGSGLITGAVNNTIGVGAFSMSSPNYYGHQNVYLGYNSGNGGLTNISYTPNITQNNVVVGSTFTGNILATTNFPASNVILGYKTYDLGLSNVKNLTAVGYGACDAAGSVTGSRTCIGMSSGADQNGTPSVFKNDQYDRVFLGGKPLGGFSGRGVVEVHSVPGQYKPFYHDAKIRDPYFPNSSVVFNSNIVVRGNFFTTNDGATLSGTNYTDITRPMFDGMHCSGDWYISISGSRSYKCTMKSTHKSWSTSIMDFRGKSCGISNGYKYPTSSSGSCPDLKTSDVRLKENISDSLAGLSEILALKPYKYTFKSDKSKTLQTGVIAQDLQKVFPNAVTKGADGYLRIRWDDMFFAMINAIKTLDRKVENIAYQIAGIESDVSKLQKSHNALHKRIAALNARATKLENNK